MLYFMRTLNELEVAPNLNLDMILLHVSLEIYIAFNDDCVILKTFNDRSKSLWQPIDQILWILLFSGLDA